jgi:hypothetical protein
MAASREHFVAGCTTWAVLLSPSDGPPAFTSTHPSVPMGNAKGRKMSPHLGRDLQPQLYGALGTEPSKEPRDRARPPGLTPPAADSWPPKGTQRPASPAPSAHLQKPAPWPPLVPKCKLCSFGVLLPLPQPPPRGHHRANGVSARGTRFEISCPTVCWGPRQPRPATVSPYK